jgi:choline dehydrogenase-like flavoprotein
MIESSASIPDRAVLHCDVCVVGAGAAGIALALELERHGRTVLLLEAGGMRSAGHAQRLYQGELGDAERHLPLDQARYRQLGGTTALWGGRCIPYDAIDFERRAWVAQPGWPIGRAELDPYYARAHRYLECGAFDYSSRSALPDAPAAMIPGFADGLIDTGTIERWSRPTHFGKAYRKPLAASSAIRVVLRAVAVSLVSGADGGRVERVEVMRAARSAREAGEGFSVRAGEVVLAGGGIETARLLMTSRQGERRGIGAASGWLGRGYMSHIHGVIARVRFRTGAPVIAGYEQDAQGVFVRRRLRLSEWAQRRHELLNLYMLLDRPLLEDPAHGSALLSAAFLAKLVLQRGRGAPLGQGKFALHRAHLRNVLTGSTQVLSVLPSFARSRFLQKRRVPSLVVSPRSSEFHLYFQAEQVADRSAGLSLVDARDALGQRQVRLDFRVQRQDTDSVWRAHGLLDRDLRRQGLGELRYEDGAAERLSQAQAVLGHHLGATRMSADPAHGVVDARCRVHGVRNLHVASASVLPTSSQANPTLTVVALALRLADQLAGLQVMSSEQSVPAGENPWHLQEEASSLQAAPAR